MAARKTKSTKADRTELIEALNAIEKEKQISKDIILEAIENSLLAACKNQFGKSENIRVNIDRETGEVKVFADYEVVEDDMIEDDALQIGITEAKLRFRDDVEVGEKVSTEVTPKNFGRIAAQKAKQVVVQKIREEERKVLYVQYLEKEREVITGIVQRYSGKNVCINLGRVDAILMESEQVRGEHFRPTEHIKLYVVEVKDTPKGPRITVSRSHPEFVKRLFEEEVTEIQDGIVTIESIAREAGSRTKIAVSTVDPNVDAVGACVGMNGSRVNAIVNELRGEKIDIVNWSDMPEIFIENALSPAVVMDVSIDEYENIFICGPCWWGTYPMAVFTQLERLDWNGKKVIAVMTHEGSGLGSCERDLKKICTGAIFEKGFAVHGADASKSEKLVADYAKQIVK